jgi:hypothetical protein
MGAGINIGFIGGIAEHQTLIARPVCVRPCGRPCNIGRLFADDIEHAAAGAVEPHVEVS